MTKHSRTLSRIQARISEGRYILSDHTTRDKVRPLGLISEDLFHAIFNG